MVIVKYWLHAIFCCLKLTSNQLPSPSQWHPLQVQFTDFDWVRVVYWSTSNAGRYSRYLFLASLCSSFTGFGGQSTPLMINDMPQPKVCVLTQIPNLVSLLTARCVSMAHVVSLDPTRVTGKEPEIQEAEVIVSEPHFAPLWLYGLPNLKLVHGTWAGIDRFVSIFSPLVSLSSCMTEEWCHRVFM